MMTAETFFANFGHLADAPNGVQKLRELIFGLAEKGQLVETTDRDVTKFLGDVAQFVMGQAPPGNECNKSGKGSVFVKTGEFGPLFPEVREWTTKPLKMAQSGDVLICVVGATIGKINLGIDCAIGRSVAAIRPNSILVTKYLYYSLMPFVLRLRSQSRGSAQGTITKKELSEVVLRVPPLEEQKRIVAKVDQLMALCDELEARQQKQQQGRVRLNNAALDALLTAREPDEFADHWQRISTNFDLLYDHPETIAKLRAAILQLAVQGKLVPQDPNDEPASVLLERIMAEKEEPSKKRGKRSRELAPVNLSEVPFEVPKGWEWARYAQVARIASNLVKPDDYKDAIHVAPDNIEKGNGRLLPCRTVKEDKVRSNKHLFFPGQIIYSKIRPNLSKATIVDFGGLCSADMYPVDAHLVPSFLLKYMLSETFLSMAIKKDTRVAMPKINQEELNKVLVPVPPLEEQKRIVAKVDQLMALCDELELRLNQAQHHSEKLVESTVRQLLVV